MASLNWQESSQKNAQHPSNSSGGVNPWFGVTMALIGIIVGFGASTIVNNERKDAPALPQQQMVQARTAPIQAVPQAVAATVPAIDFKTDHILGNAKASIAVIEYSDFECPFCKRVEPTLQQISKEYGDKVMLVYRHFPLNFHANAEKEAQASDCASDQGKFWEYHDAILERTTSNGTGFPLENLVPVAKELGLNESKFKDCLDTGKYAKHVADEESAGQAAGVTGTPGSFVLNLASKKQQFINGAQPFAKFKAAIDMMLQS